MTRIYCDICGQQFRKGKTFHEHLKRSKCTRISVLMSVLHEDNGLEINNPEGSNSPEKKSQDHTSTTHDDSLTTNEENTDIDVTNIKKEDDDTAADKNNLNEKENYDFDVAEVKKEPETSVDFRAESAGSSALNPSLSDTDSYTSDTGYEEIQVTANGDIPVSDCDNSGSDWSDDVDWDLLESQGKVESVPDLPSQYRPEGNNRNKGKHSGNKSPGFSKNVAETCKTQKRQQSEKTNDSFKEVRTEDKGKSNAGLKKTRKRKRKRLWSKPSKKRKISSDSRNVRIETDVSSSDQEEDFDKKVTRSGKIRGAGGSKKDTSEKQTRHDIKAKEKNEKKSKDKNNIPTSIQTDSESDSEQKLQARITPRKTFRQTNISKYFSPKPSPNHANKQNHSNSKEIDQQNTKEKGSNLQHEHVKQKLKRKLLSKTTDTSSDDEDSNDNKRDPKARPKGRLTREYKQLLLAQSLRKKSEGRSKSRATRMNKNDHDSDDETTAVNIRSTRQSKHRQKQVNKSSKGSIQKEKKITTVSDSCSDEEDVDNEDGDTNDSDFDIDNEDEGSDTDIDGEDEKASSDSGSTFNGQSSNSQRTKKTSKKPRKTKHEVPLEQSVLFKSYQQYTYLTDKMRLNENTQSAIKTMLNKKTVPVFLINRPVFLVNNQTNQIALECGSCKQVFNSNSKFVEHVKSHNKEMEMDKSEFICGICSKVFHCEEKLKHHMSEHISKPLPDIGDSEGIINTTPPLSSPKEQEKHDKDAAAQFICGRCKEKFSDSSSLVKHMLRHVISPNGPSNNRIDNHLIVPSLSGSYLNANNHQQSVLNNNSTRTQATNHAASSKVDNSVQESVSSSSNIPDSSSSVIAEKAALETEITKSNFNYEMNKTNDGKKNDGTQHQDKRSSIEMDTNNGSNPDSVNNALAKCIEKSIFGAYSNDSAQILGSETIISESSTNSKSVSVTEINGDGAKSTGNRTAITSNNGSTSTIENKTLSAGTSVSTPTSGLGSASTNESGSTSTSGIDANKTESGKTESDKNIAAGQTTAGPVASQTETSNKNEEPKMIDEAEILKLKNEKKKKTISKLMKYKPSFLKS